MLGATPTSTFLERHFKAIRTRRFSSPSRRLTDKHHLVFVHRLSSFFGVSSPLDGTAPTARRQAFGAVCMHRCSLVHFFFELEKRNVADTAAVRFPSSGLTCAQDCIDASPDSASCVYSAGLHHRPIASASSPDIECSLMSRWFCSFRSVLQRLQRSSLAA
jgi:hypothetical protein